MRKSDSTRSPAKPGGTRPAGSFRAGVLRLLYASGSGWLELAAVLPLLLFLAGLLTDSTEEGWRWLAGLLPYTLAAALIASVPWFGRTGILLLLNAAAVAGWTWALHGLSPRGVLAAAVGGLLAFRATQLVRFGARQELPSFSYWMGFASVMPIGFLVHRSPDLQGYGPALPYIGAGLLAEAVLLSNRATLEDAFYGGRSRSASFGGMRRMNRLLIAGFGILVLAVSLLGWGGPSLRFLRHLLPKADPRPQPLTEEPEPQEGAGLPLPPGKPSLFWVVMEKLMLGVAMVVLAALALLLLWWLLRRLPVWLRAAGRWLARYRSAQPEEETGYVDEVTSTRENQGGPWARLRERFRSGRRVRWEDLRTGSERIRYLYAQAVRRSVKDGFRWQPTWTPAETAEEAARSANRQVAERLAPGLAEAYERVRYGGQEPDEEETALWKSRSDDH